MAHRLGLLAVLAVAWTLLSGIFDNTLIITLGVVSVVGVVLLAHRMDIADEEGAPLSLLSPGSMLYGLWLTKEIVLSTAHVARVILSPRMPIESRFVRIRPTQLTDFGRTLFANSITLTPGTVSVEVDEDEFVVHALTRTTREGLRDGDMDRRVTAVEPT